MGPVRMVNHYRKKKISGSRNETLYYNMTSWKSILTRLLWLYIFIYKKNKNVPYKVSKSINRQQGYKQGKADHHGKSRVDACRTQEEEE